MDVVMKLASAVLLACGLAVFAAPKLWAEDLDAEKKKLQGRWVSTSFEAIGSQKNSRTITLNFKEEDGLSLKVDDQTYDINYSLDVDSEPKQLDIITIMGGIVVFENFGIYRLDGDTLTICHGGPIRPKKF